MDWQIVVALAIAVPVILLPVAVVWYINGAGMYLAFRAGLEKRRAVRTELKQAESKAETR